MYAYLKGTLMSSNPSHIIVEVQGIGYLLSIPYRTFSALPPIGESLYVYTTLVIREFSHTLYGFLSEQERDIFEVLMNVTGIGPKLAISLIGHLSFTDLQMAVRDQNVPMLCKVPGVGKKTAERLIVELRDKLPSLLSLNTQEEMPSSSDPHAQVVKDAMLALINLGYQQQAAQKALKQSLKGLPETIDLPTLITEALTHMR
jgi:Holliday junction DNA helicase RuvA